MMAAKKPATRKPIKPRTTAKAASLLDKHGGAFKLFANYGFAGLAFGYLLMVTIPEAQKAHTASIEKLSSENREDRKTAFDHGEKAVERIATSIDGLRGTFSTVQGTTQNNQRELIRQQSRTNELLETALPDMAKSGSVTRPAE